ncbi:MAG: asparagine synthase (glutamine-hydrolyzing) [Ferruginibacter sp.]
MCGIAGIISSSPKEVTIERLKKMTDIISHRGPDGDGHWINNACNVGLGHRRLSIIDLSHEADQPMHYMDRYSIVFNGEIYNYVELKQELIKDQYNFKTSSDTEVLLALYDKHKEACLNLLDGMFSFVIYDNVKQELFAARDRFGEKPFFYSYEPGRYLIFGSEMKALWAAGIEKKINNTMLYNYLSYGYLDNPENLSETFYSNCTRLEHSHYLKFSLVDFKISAFHKYYRINPDIQDTAISEPDAEERFKELFYTSVKRRLRSDVAVGSSLSGGLDSSLIVCIIDELKKGTRQVQKTFSACFPSYEKNEEKFIKMVSAQTNTEAHYTFPSEKGLLENIDIISYHQEEPFGSASIYAQYAVMQAAKNNNVTVLLDGQGADEYLAGYHSYYTPFFNDLRLNYPEKYKDEYNSYRSLHNDNTVNNVMQKGLEYFVRSRMPSLITPLKNSLAYYHQKTNPFFSSDFYADNSKTNFDNFRESKSLNGTLHRSILHGGLQVLLRYADRNSMSQGREVRLPFLYHELVEFVFSLPPSYKIHNGWTKWIMRSAFDDIIPAGITWRKDKIGFEPPQQSWLENKEVKEKIQNSKKILYDFGIISQREYAKDIIAGGALNSNNKAWSLWMAGNMF